MVGTTGSDQVPNVSTSKFVFDASTGSLTVSGNSNASGLTVNNSATIGTTLTVSGITSITNTTQSTSTVSGALVVSGGVGIAKDLHIGGDQYINGDSIIVGNLIVQGNTDVFGVNNLAVTDNLIELHTDANLTPLTEDDGKDIGFRFHYYKGVNDNAALIWSNDEQILEWYGSGAGGDANVINYSTAVYGNIKTGNLVVVRNSIVVSVYIH
jgi:hypothetical protein